MLSRKTPEKAFQHGKGPEANNFHMLKLNLDHPDFFSWLVVSAQLKNICQIGSFLEVGVKIKNVGSHHLVLAFPQRQECI